VWEPSSQKIQVRKYPVKLDGKNLPNSMTEDIRGFPLCPKYSREQLREINRRQRRKSFSYDKCSLKRSNLKPRRDIHQSKQLLLKRAYREEAIL